MGGYLGTKAVLLSTTAANVTGNADITGNLTVGGNLTVSGTTITVDHANAQTVDLGDNDKIRLGADYELQLWSDGTTGQISGDINHTGSLTTDGLTLGGNVTFGDNNKIIMGAGSDLQIYHDGDHSIIEDAGTGAIKIKVGDFRVENASGNNLIKGVGDVATLHHAGSEKLATTSTGIDVTGAITSDGLTVDGAALVQAGNGATATLSLNNANGNGTMSQLNLGYTADPDHGNIKYTGDMVFHTGGNNERMRLTSAGNVIHTPASQGNAFVPNTSSTWNALEIFQDRGVTNSASGIAFRSQSGTAPAGIVSVAGNTTGGIEDLAFMTASGNQTFERARLDSSGNLLVGKTSNDFSTNGVILRGTGEILVTRNSNVATFRRNSTDGEIVNFRSDATSVGGIGVQSSDLVIYSSASGHEGLRFGNGAIVPTNNTGVSTDNACNLGGAGGRFTDVYLAGGVFLGGTGLANKLHDYEEGSWTPVIGGNSSTSGQSYSQQQGTYTKIGNAVHLHAYVAFTTTGTISGSYATIQGLPFNVANNNGSYAAVNVGYYSGLGISVTSLQGYTTNNNDFAYLTHSPSAQAAISYLTPSQLGTTPALIFSITYNTNS